MEKEHELPRQRPTLPTATADGLLYERLDQALAWADGHDRQGTELFVGVNGRSIEGKTKAAVPAVTACFADLDLGAQRIDEALAALTSGATPAPSFIVNSGYGLHAVWLLREPSRDKARWWAIQHALVRAFADYRADPVCAPNEACILRLVPYPNRKLCPEGVSTALVMQSGTRYDLAALLDAFAPPAATRLHDIPGPPPSSPRVLGRDALPDDGRGRWTGCARSGGPPLSTHDAHLHPAGLGRTPGL
jgi:hypothetical protein